MSRQYKHGEWQLPQAKERVEQGQGAVTGGFGACVEVRTSHSVREQRVTSKDGRVVENEGRAFAGVSRCMYGCDGRTPDLNTIALDDCLKRKSCSLLLRQKERGASLRGEFPGARQMVRVDMGFENVSNRPFMPGLRKRRAVTMDL